MVKGREGPTEERKKVGSEYGAARRWPKRSRVSRMVESILLRQR
jgi:hypothetical protein